jgi:hypothetical protein
MSGLPVFDQSALIQSAEETLASTEFYEDRIKNIIENFEI